MSSTPEPGEENRDPFPELAGDYLPTMSPQDYAEWWREEQDRDTVISETYFGPVPEDDGTVFTGNDLKEWYELCSATGVPDRWIEGFPVLLNKNAQEVVREQLDKWETDFPAQDEA